MWLTVHLWIVQETIDLSCTIHQSVQETIDLSCAVHQRCDIYSRNFESSCFIGGGSIFPMLIKSFSDIKNNFILPWMLNYALSINFLIQMIDIQLGTDHLTWMEGGLWFFVSFRKKFPDNTRVRIFIFFVVQSTIFFLQNLTLGYMTNTLNQIFFFPPPKSEYFFQQHWESEYFF